eukprot:TRINITY_DN14569_c0_g1_i2.p1 TRINITY_DN14569_c0_g1~~TRINITY_DN14569_c0_g1_i2.p1  ORF type:complete len:510 (-),score=89.43 TRINITY_DN14569_c0_g1_i2:39-1568(-)
MLTRSQRRLQQEQLGTDIIPNSKTNPLKRTNPPTWKEPAEPAKLSSRYLKQEDCELLDEGTYSTQATTTSLPLQEPCSSSNTKAKRKRTTAYEKYIIAKLCEVCRVAERDDLLLLCDYCDDAYHSYCLKPPLEELPPEDSEWVCPVCVEAKRRMEAEKNSGKKRQSILEEHFDGLRRAPERICGSCNEMITTSERKELAEKAVNAKRRLLLREFCVRCSRHFHSTCFGGTNASSLICGECSSTIEKELPTSEKTLKSFFSTSAKKDKSSPGQSKDEVDSPKSGKRRKKTMKDSVLRLPIPAKDPKRAEELQLSLARAMIAKGIVFDDDLCFPHHECPPEKNEAALEPSLQKMDSGTFAVFEKFKEMSRRGVYAPLEVVEDEKQGYIVRADARIPARTLIAEYVGEVDFARNHVFDDNDSIMDLLRTVQSSTSLVIIPKARANIARFLSGINNTDKKAKSERQNVRSVRFNVKGSVRVLLYAFKEIKKGEILYYDYNEGGFDEYPTQDFV